MALKCSSCYFSRGRGSRGIVPADWLLLDRLFFRRVLKGDNVCVFEVYLLAKKLKRLNLLFVCLFVISLVESVRMAQEKLINFERSFCT